MSEIAPNFTEKNWKDLELDDMNHPHWQTAIDKFWQRLNTRYLRPIKILLETHALEKNISDEEDDPQKLLDNRRIRPGFIILMIDCILIETIQAFSDGVDEKTIKDESFKKMKKEDRQYSGAAFFGKFVKKCEIKIECNGISQELTAPDIDLIHNHYRNDLAHAAKTGSNFTIKDKGPIFRKIPTKAGSKYFTYEINRSLFHEQVVTEIIKYCELLRDSTQKELREKFIMKFNEICETPTAHRIK